MTHSERMAALEELAGNIKGGLDALIEVKRKGNSKQVAFWVGKVSHDVASLGRQCMDGVVQKRKVTKP